MACKINCPKCGADITVVGFTTIERKVQTFRPAAGGGFQAGAAATGACAGAYCILCDALLPVGAAQLLERAA